MDRKICFFIGHRDAPGGLLSVLREAVKEHIEEKGVTDFVVGNYGAFDHLAARAVIDAKQFHPEAMLSPLLPYHPAERPTKTPRGFDNTFYPPGMERVPRRLAIVRANRYMVDHADYLIAYAWHPASNAQGLVAYAERRSTIKVTNIALLYDGYGDFTS